MRAPGGPGGATTAAGTIAAIWRYPVKSMRGEQLARAHAGERGLDGDRSYAVLDRDTGRIASAKHPRRFARLLECRATLGEASAGGAAPVTIELPDGSTTGSMDPDVDRRLSDVLGVPVSLVSGPMPGASRDGDRSPLEALGSVIRLEPLALASSPGLLFDVAPIHLLTTATLSWLASRRSGTTFEPERFRPNLMVETREAAPGPELAWLGRSLVSDAGVALRVIDPCPRCVVTTLPQGQLRKEPDVLRALHDLTASESLTLAPGVAFRAVAGVYAVVGHGGSVAIGHPVYCLG